MKNKLEIDFMTGGLVYDLLYVQVGNETIVKIDSEFLKADDARMKISGQFRVVLDGQERSVSVEPARGEGAVHYLKSFYTDPRPVYVYFCRTRQGNGGYHKVSEFVMHKGYLWELPECIDEMFTAVNAVKRIQRPKR